VSRCGGRGWRSSADSKFWVARARLPTCHPGPPMVMHVDRDTSANFLPITSPSLLTLRISIRRPLIFVSASGTSTTQSFKLCKHKSRTGEGHVCLGLDLGRWCHCFLCMASDSSSYPHKQTGHATAQVTWNMKETVG
jgi:hypothetical protein